MLVVDEVDHGRPSRGLARRPSGHLPAQLRRRSGHREGTKVAGISGTPVALEADGLDEATGEAWSVVVRGRAHSITEQHDVMDTADLPLHPWHGGRKDRFVRITPDVISGRRFAVADPSVWRTGLDHRSAATD